MNKPLELPGDVAQDLRALLGDRYTSAIGIRDQHGKDESSLPYASPQAVVYPTSTEEVQHIARICHRHKVPMIPYGAGTSLEGHVLAVRGGVTIDMSRMNRILVVHG